MRNNNFANSTLYTVYKVKCTGKWYLNCESKCHNYQLSILAIKFNQKYFVVVVMLRFCCFTTSLL